MPLSALEQGFSRLRKADRNREREQEAEVRIASLTPRERDVLAGLANGSRTRASPTRLGLSPRTVEIHRANLMQKLGVRSLSEALRIAFAAGIGEAFD